MNILLLEEIFTKLLPYPINQREKKLATLCGDDLVLKAEVRSLLESEKDAIGFLAHSPNLTLVPKLPERVVNINDIIGSYKIIKKLGQGGMGTVYLADRSDGRFQHSVAIKILHQRFNSNIEFKRFESERQILAALKHPNIARLLDVDNTEQTENSQPYLLMEFIEGTSITNYCDRNKLSISEKLRLFLTVCHSVQYAHQNLVLHRDLKPANILVNTEGIVKLIDFGTAKLVWNNAFNDQAAIITGMYPLTPEYAAPEQISGLAINTATDVYALGIILYELLTGHRPYQFINKTLANIVTTICEQIPPAPSLFNKTNQQKVGPELDNIVLRCLQKQQGNRYDNVLDLARDIQCYLNGFAIKNYTQSYQYHVGKFIKRHKLTVSLSSIAIIFILSSGVMTTWQWYIASFERKIAERRYTSVIEMANNFIFNMSSTIHFLPKSTQIQETLIKKGIQYLNTLIANAPNDPKLLLELSNAYSRLATVQGNLLFQNLGKTGLAFNNYNKAIEIKEYLLANNPFNTEIIYDTAKNYYQLSLLTASIGKVDEALQLVNRCIDFINKTGGPKSKKAKLIYLNCNLTLLHFYNYKKDYTQALKVLAIVAGYYTNGVIHDSFFIQVRQGRYYEELAEVYSLNGQLSEAIKTLEQYVAFSTKLKKSRPHSAMIAYAHHALAKKLIVNKNFILALKNYRHSISNWESQQPFFPYDARRKIGLASVKADYANSLINFASKLRVKDNKSTACRLFKESEQLMKELPNPDVGYGIRIFNLTEQVHLRKKFKLLCKT